MWLTVKAVPTSLIGVITCSFRTQLLPLPNPKELRCYQQHSPAVLPSCCPTGAQCMCTSILAPLDPLPILRREEWALGTALGQIRMNSSCHGRSKVLGLRKGLGVPMLYRFLVKLKSLQFLLCFSLSQGSSAIALTIAYSPSPSHFLHEYPLITEPSRCANMFIPSYVCFLS